METVVEENPLSFATSRIVTMPIALNRKCPARVLTKALSSAASLRAQDFLSYSPVFRPLLFLGESRERVSVPPQPRLDCSPPPHSSHRPSARVHHCFCQPRSGR